MGIFCFNRFRLPPLFTCGFFSSISDWGGGGGGKSSSSSATSRYEGGGGDGGGVGDDAGVGASGLNSSPKG